MSALALILTPLCVGKLSFPSTVEQGCRQRLGHILYNNSGRLNCTVLNGKKSVVSFHQTRPFILQALLYLQCIPAAESNKDSLSGEGEDSPSPALHLNCSPPLVCTAC